MNSKWQLKYLVPKLVDKLIVYGDAYSRFMTQILQPLTWVNYTQFYDSVALATDLSHISISTLVSHPVLTSSLSVLLSFIETEGRRGESISTLVSHPVLISSLSVLLSFIETEGRRREFFGFGKRPPGLLLITLLMLGRDLGSCWPLSINTNSVHSRLEIIARCGWFIGKSSLVDFKIFVFICFILFI